MVEKTFGKPLDTSDPLSVAAFAVRVGCDIDGTEPTRQMYIDLLERREAKEGLEPGTYTNDPRVDDFVSDLTS